jgi:competence protein ComEC
MASMATHAPPSVPLGGDAPDVALQHPPWRMAVRLSSAGDAAERFLAGAGFDRGPWLVVALMAGIAAWFVFRSPEAWVATMASGVIVALGALSLWRGREDRGRVLTACVAVGLLVAGGTGLIWLRSALVGTEGIARPLSVELSGRVLERVEQPADQRVRLVLATREPESGRAIKVRVNVPLAEDRAGLAEGALVRLRARLMPPAPPMLPGGYDFARAAWFDGLAATGSLQGPVTMLQPSRHATPLAGLQRALSAHVRAQLGGSPGAIAAAFASGDRGAIAQADEDAMRDAGLTHLLSISGVHVSALIAVVYFAALKLLALWSWLALRVRMPLLAAVCGAAAGVAYTLLTGAEVPTVRSCVGALLVLGALALGREPLSLRMVAVAAAVVLLVWPEALVGPSFQMSFAAVIAIVALHESAPARWFLRPREQGWLAWLARHTAMLLIAGFAIELTLTPIVLFHFHRAGLYGAFANVIAIPLVSFVTMPAIALALLLDLGGIGAPAWWVAGKSLALLLGIAHWTAGQPGAVRLMPQMSELTFALFLAGGMWLALWRGRVRILGLVPALVAAALLLATPVPDILVSGDGRQVGITGEGRLLMLRETKSEFTLENLQQLAGDKGQPLALADWPGGRCSKDFCVLALKRAGREWQVLMSRTRSVIEERQLAAACERVDVVISDRWLPSSCHPRWLKADARYLRQSGGLAIGLPDHRVTAVADSQREQGWWRPARGGPSFRP